MKEPQLQPNHFLGLIKFFRSEEYLNQLIAGKMHCQTPETYRLHKDEGVSDKVESCLHSWRKARGDAEVYVEIDGIQIDPKDLVGFTLHRSDSIESWLHCWFSLRLPADNDAMEQLKADLRKMKEYFGRDYVFILNKDVLPFISLLKEASNENLWCGEVSYSDNSMEWNERCKSTAYSYQHEYRFGFGQCDTNEIEPYVFFYPQGFSHLMHKNLDFKLAGDDGTIFFDLRAI
ncbi:hypothetical protein [Pseudomonas luteola]|uniref:Uncharacterized protein n=1 Tax=Pseudomonas luteola TaxID=47886 RepID=A0ABS0N0J2_PSELU|nr:hypothetical protein [Pseudomonas luteola]MBH3441813.1 hypothetical protein [Pseudomonas luteola]